MTDTETPPEYCTRADGVRLAYRHLPGRGPTMVFLPGYMSDMQGGKAQAVAAWAAVNGRAMLRLDYSGCGESDGAFDDGTLDIWRNDVLQIIRHVDAGPVVLVGSSMGGWLMLLVAQALDHHVRALVGIAAAPDFTDWGFSDAEKTVIAAKGRLEQYSPYGPDPTVTTGAFWQSGEANRQLDGEIAVDCPVRLLHGQQDTDVPWEVALRLANRLRSSDVQTILIKDGDHRLSRDEDIALLIDVIAKL
ncbi:MAG: alpha/beta hydrolase [Sphingorhabdus sp.]